MVLPAPLCPITPNVSPAATVNDTPSTARVPPYRLQRSLTSIAVILRGSRPSRARGIARSGGPHPPFGGWSRLRPFRRMAPPRGARDRPVLEEPYKRPDLACRFPTPAGYMITT
nr:hypothetical protein GCM10020093_016410 [Planobispora longispora]